MIRSSRFRDKCNRYRWKFNGDTQMRFACWVIRTKVQAKS